MSTQDRRAVAFRQLHEAGCFVMPNPWDAGSARALEGLGFPALASTSAGLAWTLGHPDNQATLAETLAHLRAIAAAVSVPVNADLEGGYAVEPAQVAANVTLAAGTGIAGPHRAQPAPISKTAPPSTPPVSSTTPTAQTGQDRSSSRKTPPMTSTLSRASAASPAAPTSAS